MIDYTEIWTNGYDAFESGDPKIAPTGMTDREEEFWEDGWQQAWENNWTHEDAVAEGDVEKAGVN